MRLEAWRGWDRRWIVALGVALVLACEGFDENAVERWAELPANTGSASVAMTVVVPEGEWELWLGVHGMSEVRVRPPSTPLEELSPLCSGFCASRGYALNCPSGKCRYEFDIDVSGAGGWEPEVYAKIPLADEDEGCGPDPHYVPPEDVDRLFEISFLVSNLALASDDGGWGGRPDAALGWDWDASFARDAGSAPDGGRAQGASTWDDPSPARDATVTLDGTGAQDAAWAPESGPIAAARSSVLDARDGQRYDTVTIGNQTWMAQNLNYGAQQQGVQSQVRFIDDGKVEKYCLADDPEQCRVAGGLYSWAEALALPAVCGQTLCGQRVSSVHQGICPSGWHVPSHAEWSELALYLAQRLGFVTGDENLAWPLISRMLKATSLWPAPAAGSDESGFGTVPTSDWVDLEREGALMKGALLQSSEEQSAVAVSGPVLFQASAGYSSFGKEQAASLRCVQDR